MAEAPSSKLLPASRRSLLGGVLLPPVILLTALSLRYALVVAACRHGIVRVPLEAIALGSLIIIALLLIRSWRVWRQLDPPTDVADVQSTDRFLAGLGLLSGALSLIATLALWLPSAFLGPCGADVA